MRGLSRLPVYVQDPRWHSQDLSVWAEIRPPEEGGEGVVVEEADGAHQGRTLFAILAVLFGPAVKNREDFRDTLYCRASKATFVIEPVPDGKLALGGLASNLKGLVLENPQDPVAGQGDDGLPQGIPRHAVDPALVVGQNLELGSLVNVEDDGAAVRGAGADLGAVRGERQADHVLEKDIEMIPCFAKNLSG